MKPCRYGHKFGRYTSTNRCVECSKSRNRDWKLKNREKIYADNRRWRRENPDKIRIKEQRWRLKNPDKKNSLTALRRAGKLKATPRWLTKNQKIKILNFYKQAKKLRLEVDHIIPLRGESVCGLHVPWNLQLLTAKENRKKGNRMTG